MLSSYRHQRLHEQVFSSRVANGRRRPRCRSGQTQLVGAREGLSVEPVWRALPLRSFAVAVVLGSVEPQREAEIVNAARSATAVSL